MPQFYCCCFVLKRKWRGHWGSILDWPADNSNVLCNTLWLCNFHLNWIKVWESIADSTLAIAVSGAENKPKRASGFSKSPHLEEAAYHNWRHGIWVKQNSEELLPVMFGGIPLSQHALAGSLRRLGRNSDRGERWLRKERLHGAATERALHRVLLIICFLLLCLYLGSLWLRTWLEVSSANSLMGGASNTWGVCGGEERDWEGMAASGGCTVEPGTTLVHWTFISRGTLGKASEVSGQEMRDGVYALVRHWWRAAPVGGLIPR